MQVFRFIGQSLLLVKVFSRTELLLLSYIPLLHRPHEATYTSIDFSISLARLRLVLLIVAVVVLFVRHRAFLSG